MTLQPRRPAALLTRLAAWLAALAALAAWPALAAAQASATAEPTPTFFGELVSIVLPLAFIILGLLVVLHFAKRRYGMTGQGLTLTVIQILPLGPRERLVVVRTRTGRVFTVGVSSQTVNLVTELDPDELVLPEPETEAAVGTPARPPKLFGLPLNRRVSQQISAAVARGDSQSS